MVDYEGHLCCTVFTAGCNFRCPYCHNSDLVEGKNLHQISEEEFFVFLTKRKGLLDSVCVSGGEPTLQPDLIDFLKKIKALGFQVKLDSNGTAPKLLKELIENKLVDYIAMDIKNSRESYHKTAGNGHFNLKNIEESVEFLKQGKVPYEFRTTLVAG
ncbi:MAG: anaerobic ribonucleoside-triphosphate reductase activating protein, partial [Acetobacter sp.]|nr:anaerobic ribonucleoside-triphosphate reductase activating protein [Acetobacter sp.]